MAPEVFNLPNDGGQWAIQEKTTEFAQKAIASLKQSGFATDTEFGRIVVRLIRAALLDKTIYREVCADPAAAGESRKAMAGLIAVNSLIPVFLSLGSLSIQTLVAVAAMAVVQALGWYARAWVVQLVAANWLKKNLVFTQIFRPLIYAQAPTALGFIPVLGQLIGLWALVTNTSAIRDTTGCTTVQAVVLSVAGFVGVTACASVVSPIVSGIFRMVG